MLVALSFFNVPSPPRGGVFRAISRKCTSSWKKDSLPEISQKLTDFVVS
jgi:hypothetical protein